MEDPASFLARKAVKGMVGAIGSQYKKSRREKTNAVDLGEIRFELLMSFRGHAKGPGKYQTAAVCSLDYDSSREILATAGADGTVRIWSKDRPDGRVIHSMPGQSARSVAFASDGRLAIGGATKRLIVMEPVSANDVGPEVVRSWDYKHALSRVAWAPHGSVLAAYTSSGDVVTCDASGGPLQVLFHRRFGDFVGAPCLRFTPDGTRIARSTYESVAAHTTAGDQAESIRVAKSRTCGFDFSVDGRQIAVGVDDGLIHVFQWPGGEPVRVLRSHAPLSGLGATVPAVEYSPDGQMIATAGYDGVLQIWRANDGALLGRKDCQGGIIYALKWISGGKEMAVATGFGAVQVWALARPGDW